jgi:hypothetical protein
VPLWGSTQTTISLGQCSCACCSVSGLAHVAASPFTRRSPETSRSCSARLLKTVRPACLGRLTILRSFPRRPRAIGATKTRQSGSSPANVTREVPKTISGGPRYDSSRHRQMDCRCCRSLRFASSRYHSFTFAERSAGSEANSQLPASRTAPPPITLSNAQIETLLREIGIRPDSRIETPSRPVRKPSPPPQPTAPRHWRQHSGSAAADGGETTRLMVDELQQRGVAVDIASESGPPQPTARRHWRQYSGRGAAGRGEATRLTVDELQQRGVAVDTAAGSGSPK